VFGQPATHLVHKHANHVRLCPLQPTEGAPKVELNVVSFTLHTDPQQHMSFSIERQKDIFANQVDVLGWIEAEVRAAKKVVFACQTSMTHCDHEPRHLTNCNVKRFVPPRVVVIVDSTGLSVAIAILVRENDKGIWRTRVAF
jgi:hypothetical protein